MLKLEAEKDQLFHAVRKKKRRNKRWKREEERKSGRKEEKGEGKVCMLAYSAPGLVDRTGCPGKCDFRTLKKPNNNCSDGATL